MNRIELLCEWKAQVDSYTLKLVASVPDEFSDYAPKQELMSFSRLVHHLADCEVELAHDIASSLETPHSGPELEYNSSVIINAQALKEVFGFTDTVLRGLSEVDLEGEIRFPDRSSNVSILHIVKTMIEHQLHHRGQLINYCRLAGLKPPLRWKD